MFPIINNDRWILLYEYSSPNGGRYAVWAKEGGNTGDCKTVEISAPFNTVTPTYSVQMVNYCTPATSVVYTTNIGQGCGL